MKKVFILPLCLLFTAILFSCSTEETPDLPQIEYGEFQGYIGSAAYYIENDKVRDRIITTFYNGSCCQFQFNGVTGPSEIYTNYLYAYDPVLTVNLVDVFNTQKPLSFDTYNGMKNYQRNWVAVDLFEQKGDDKTSKLYTTLKEKQFAEAENLSVDYRELKVPSLKVKIKGYLYNIDNRGDSIFIDATIKTQASY